MSIARAHAMSLFIWLPLILVIGLMGYVRFAPQNLDRWHQDLDISEDQLLAGGVKKWVSADFDALHAVILNEPRTKLVAGGLSDGHATYVTRSLLWGFPDYTTVQKDGDHIQIYARLVFGRSDMGVNAQRVDRWIDALPAN